MLVIGILSAIDTLDGYDREDVAGLLSDRVARA